MASFNGERKMYGNELDFSVLEGKTLTKIVIKASEDNASYAPDPGDNEI